MAVLRKNLIEKEGMMMFRVFSESAVEFLQPIGSDFNRY